MRQLAALTQPFPSRFVKQPPQGKHGSYVPHDIVNQRALAIVGPHSFEVVSLIADAGKVVGVLGRLTVEVDGRTVVITEVGDEEFPDQGNSASNAKKAASDAYKRCWMRLGLGLHLWSGSDYELPAMLEHYSKEAG